VDTELARTFLEIVSTKSFVRAAERLNVAQTTVSARIRLLEDKLVANSGAQEISVTLKDGGNRAAPGTKAIRRCHTPSTHPLNAKGFRQSGW